MNAPLLQMRGIDKSFPGVHALRSVDLTLHEGEVLALLGENGAGKSTLMKVLGGAYPPDAGTVTISGKPVTIRNPNEARAAGVGIIYQEFNLVPGLSARENIFLGQEWSRFDFVSQREERRKANDLFKRIGLEVNPDALCRDLSVAEQQVVEIAKALSLNARIIVMDEPSATLTPREVAHLFEIVRELKSQGIGVIYISHRLDEIFAICDRVTVMRDGSCVGSKPIGEIDRSGMIEMMVGRKLDNEFPKDLRRKAGTERLKVRNLRRGRRVKDVSFVVRAGEVLGFTGLVGAGRTETMRLIFGADVAESGEIELDGKLLQIRNPRAAIRSRIGLLTEDRKGQGLVLNQSLRSNFGLPNLSHLSRYGLVDQGKERRDCGGFIKSLQIKTPDQEQAAKNLSGGNQQKVVLAKWLERDCDVLIFDEPTRGIDVGAKYEIYLLINRLAAEGKAIIIISSELPEVLGMCDRILVMHEGQITGEITDVDSATQEQIMQLAVR
ncbi:MAG: sugar ABC transporter ATP-binding protein [Chthoniobacterales bacterium]|nr:sugar ABC transporter ATP-binding protein [Chthoniobacterales bacterium]